MKTFQTRKRQISQKRNHLTHGRPLLNLDPQDRWSLLTSVHHLKAPLLLLPPSEAPQLTWEPPSQSHPRLHHPLLLLLVHWSDHHATAEVRQASSLLRPSNVFQGRSTCPQGQLPPRVLVSPGFSSCSPVSPKQNDLTPTLFLSAPLPLFSPSSLRFPRASQRLERS